MDTITVDTLTVDTITVDTITVDKLKRRASSFCSDPSCRILYELFQTFTEMIYLTECATLQCVT